MDVISYYTQLFKEADENGDNSLSYEELRKSLEKYGYSNFSMAQFKKIDTSGDNKITFDEYYASMQSMAMEVHVRAVLTKTFNEYDTNGDGEIDRSELAAVVQKIKGGDPDLIMSCMDKDKSGKISREEFISTVAPHLQ